MQFQLQAKASPFPGNLTIATLFTCDHINKKEGVKKSNRKSIFSIHRKMYLRVCVVYEKFRN